MVLAQGMADRLKERREKFKAELIAQGKAELAAKVAEWNRLRLEAEARGEKFYEPPPME